MERRARRPLQRVSLRSGCQQMVFLGISHRFQACMDAQLVEDVFDMIAHRGLMDDQLVGDLLRVGAFGEEREHLLLA